jgi:pimeloyl-ACP methyl ester carboxylesterase
MRVAVAKRIIERRKVRLGAMLGFGLAVLLALAPRAAANKPRWQELPLPPPMPDASEHGLVDTPGARIYYARYGAADGPAVVLLHGGLGNGDHWANQVAALGNRFDIVTVDSRGHGRSTRGKQPVTYDMMANDVLAVMDHLAITRAALVGWSDGGEIAMKIAISHPERVSKLFVFGANYDANGSKQRGAPRPTFHAYAAKCRADYLRLSPTPNQWEQLVEWMRPVWRNPMGFTKEQLRAIQAPTVIADGDHDEVIVVDQLQEMAKLIPNATLQIFPDTSHFALWQDPETFDDALVAFLTNPTAPASSPPR